MRVEMADRMIALLNQEEVDDLIAILDKIITGMKDLAAAEV